MNIGTHLYTVMGRSGPIGRGLTLTQAAPLAAVSGCYIVPDGIHAYIDWRVAEAEQRISDQIEAECQLIHDRITSVHSRALRALTDAITPNGGNSTDV